MTSRDATLVKLAARGDDDALEELARTHHPTVRRTALAILGDPDLADDVAQDVFVRLQASLPGFRAEAELSTWLYRVTLNLCRDQLRGVRRRVNHLPISSAVESAIAIDTSRPDRTIDAQRATAAVRAALERLPDDQREAVSLRYIADLPYAEIARLTQTPAGTIASRIFRALVRLGQDIEPHHMEVIR